nr:amino acid permease [Anaeromicropila herbilytica]
MHGKEKGLSAWQLTMMAVGTVIGGSFFLGSAVVINATGPSVLLSFILGGILVYFILYALSEMTVSKPTAGSFQTYASDAYGPGLGFVVGWVYWTGMSLAMSSEATAVSILIREWFPGISIAVLGSVIIVGVTLLNLLGADKLSKLESGLAIIKVVAVVAFIVLAVLLIVGLIPGTRAAGVSQVATESFAPGGLGGFAGSLLIVMFAYSGFEIIGLAASETENPQETVPKAINYTVVLLVSIYIIAIGLLLFLTPTSILNERTSPFVAALNRWGMGWAGTIINFVLITAILSTMLAAMFGLGRMIRTLADAGQAPKWLDDTTDIPRKGILFTGVAMLLGLWFGLLLPSVYLFLVSSGGFAVLFTYAVIVASHIRFRKANGCPEGKCRLGAFPYSSLFVLVCLIIAMFSMPFIGGQTYGFIAGIAITVLYSVAYLIMKAVKNRQGISDNGDARQFQTRLSTEFSKELTFDKERKYDEGDRDSGEDEEEEYDDYNE